MAGLSKAERAMIDRLTLLHGEEYLALGGELPMVRRMIDRGLIKSHGRMGGGILITLASDADALPEKAQPVVPRPPEQRLADDLIKGAREAAAYTGLPVRTIYNAVEAGHIPHSRLGKLLFFRKSELERFFVADR